MVAVSLIVLAIAAAAGLAALKAQKSHSAFLYEHGMMLQQLRQERARLDALRVESKEERKRLHHTFVNLKLARQKAQEEHMSRLKDLKSSQQEFTRFIIKTIQDAQARRPK